ncbi:Short-chain dehydrogenase/reductase SDR [Hyphomicrobium sp. GJ21]|uniref:SDR family NAD(P)-dependent oxidoreductase n=1 Tax=Hyphomicrobium sp. GJ21 TaxID=113574 RepID=UPI000622C179|nr:SDR family NAD(P)-dependent oxidoreductase [Hyphomicrobium sp. GJ21]CEJ89106.1 Short-chain dehydrogenase/reductase SDR [Hyphomicrobium sp. GJ21]
MPTVLITGTSTGFGLVTTVELAERGWNVIATMRDLGKRAGLDRAVAAANVQGLVSVEQLDVTDPKSIDAAIARLDAEGRPLDAVVHNAGVAVGGAFEDLSEANIRRVMEVNYFGVLALTQKLLPGFRARRRGRILIVSSESAFAGQPANSPYCASKWAIEGWAEAVAYELAPFGIDIILIEPGAYRTNIWESSPRVLPETSAYRPLLRHLEVTVDTYVAKSARDPIEVAKAIANALDAPRPRFRTAVGPTAKFMHLARGKLPSRTVRKIFGRFFALQKVRW